MSFQVQIENLTYGVRSNPTILHDIQAIWQEGQFIAVVGENGAGMTTLLDLLMGFKKPSQGSLLIQGQAPHEDHWQLRQEIAYLSEKVDIPGDWSVQEFLDFNKYFYPNYSSEFEKYLCEQFKVSKNGRLGNMSAGELRRVQVVGALSIRPKLIVVDEITAVLDIIARRRFLNILADLNRDSKCTIVLATNILEDLENYISHIFLLRHGRTRLFQPFSEFLGQKDKSQFSQLVADILDEQ